MAHEKRTEKLGEEKEEVRQDVQRGCGDWHSTDEITMNLISFEPWEDDEWANRQELKILWPIIILLLCFAFITQSFVPFAYAFIAFIVGVFFTFESLGKKTVAIPPVLGFGKNKNIPIAIVIGIFLGLVFTIPAFVPQTGQLSLKSLTTTQEATLIQAFFEKLSLRLSLNDVNYWTNAFYQVITAGFIEEVFFRGLLVPFLSFLFRNWRIGVFGANIAFGFYHLYVYNASPMQVFFAVFFGFVVTLVDYKVKSLLPGIVAHMMNNAVFGGFIKVCVGC